MLIRRNTPIGTLHRFLTGTIPSSLLSLDESLTGGATVRNARAFGNYVAFGRHPTVLIFFLALLVLSEYFYLPSAWPQLSTPHRFFGIIAIFLPYVFLYLSVFTDPGTVTHESLANHMRLYPYDFTVFHPGSVCRTCHILKPARSKHCAICKRCVAKLDHHCVFINGCVGYGNQHWFLLLLLSTATLALYGGLLGIKILGGRAMARFPGWARWKPAGMEWDAWLTGWVYGIQTSVGMGSVTLLAILTSPMVWALFGYQVYLIWCGTTTNETMKWGDWKDDIDDGYAFMRRLPANRLRNPNVEAPIDRWPVEAIQIVVRTTDGLLPSSENELPGVGDWIRVRKLAEVENLYDLGFWDNMADVFIPNYQFNTDTEDGNMLPGSMHRNGNRQRRKSGRRRD